jgi:hypothetical protein
MMSIRKACVSAAVIAAVSLPTLGADLRLTVEGASELQFDSTFDADAAGDELSDLFTKTEPTFALQLGPRWRLVSQLSLERVRQDRDGDNRLFGDHGLYAKSLYAEYGDERWIIQAGKIAPAFGLAWDEAPGIYGRQFAEDYEINQRLGLSAGLVLGAEKNGPKHTLTAAVFRLDDTELSRSTLKDRGRTRRVTGGLSNTRDPSSFTLALDGEGLAWFPALHYHLALRHQQAGVTEAKDERGYVVGVDAEVDGPLDFSIRPLVEYAHLLNATGLAQDRNYWTVGAEVRRNAYIGSLSTTWRMTDPAAERDNTDFLFQASFGRFLTDDARIELGYRFRDDDGAASNTFGLRLKAEFAFGEQ